MLSGGSELESVPLSKDVEIACVGKSSVVVGGGEDAYVLKFPSSSGMFDELFKFHLLCNICFLNSVMYVFVYKSCHVISYLHGL